MFYQVDVFQEINRLDMSNSIVRKALGIVNIIIVILVVLVELLRS